MSALPGIAVPLDEQSLYGSAAKSLACTAIFKAHANSMGARL